VCVCVCVCVESLFCELFGLQKKEKEESEKNHADALEQHACDVQQLTRDGYAGGVDARRLNGSADNDALCRLEDC
jgi:hypothetical protein